ncbi:MAG: glutamyl-tRNA reductase [Acidimicrobiia bacterium]
MSVVVIGLNHRTAPLDLLERMTVPSEQLGKALHDLCTRPNVTEAVVLSTCNRTEIYVVAERFHGAYQDVREFMASLAGLPPEDFGEHLYSLFDESAVSHLFEVASGLDSAVIGEAEILGQVKLAWERSQEEAASRSLLNVLFRHALETGKRARTETAISRSTTSIPQVAVAMAADALGGSIEGRSALVIGAGDMGEGSARALVGAHVGDLAILNRTVSRAADVAGRYGARPLGFIDLVHAIGDADVVVTSTGAEVWMLERDTVETVMATRPDRPLVLVDIAVPRDVDPGVASIDGVTLLDLDDLRVYAERSLANRRAESERVREIVQEEVVRYQALTTAREAAPLIAELRAKAESVRLAELDRQRGRLASLDDREREAVEALTKGIIAKLLHEPSVRLKDVAGTPRGERLAEALRDLFAL